MVLCTQLHSPPSEEVRLQHRHIDLRRPLLQRNIRLRSQVAMAGQALSTQSLSWRQVLSSTEDRDRLCMPGSCVLLQSVSTFTR